MHKGAKRFGQKPSIWGTTWSTATHRQVSFSVNVPDEGVVICMFGSDSQVTAPLNLRMYLYWIAVLAGRFTVTARASQRDPRRDSGRITYCSKWDSSPRRE